jgi:hypothetical protein
VCVAVHDGLERRGVDHILEAGEPFGSAPFDLVDYAFRSACAVADHHLAGSRSAIVLIGLQRVGRVGISRPVVREAGGVQDGLADAIGAHRVHRVRGVPQQGDSPPGPVRQWIPVAHRELEAFLGGVDEFSVVEERRTEPADMGLYRPGWRGGTSLGVEGADHRAAWFVCRQPSW